MVDNGTDPLGDLMKRVQAGDKSAYADLLRQVAELLRRYVQRRSGRGEANEDVVQEILMALHQARHTYDPHQAFRPWLFAIARYKLADHWRRLGRQNAREVSLGDEMDGVMDEIFISTSPSAGEGLSDQLQKALEALPAAQRQIVSLLKEKDMTVRDAARELGMSETALKTAAHRAYKSLRQFLERPLYGNR